MDPDVKAVLEDMRACIEERAMASGDPDIITLVQSMTVEQLLAMAGLQIEIEDMTDPSQSDAATESARKFMGNKES